MKSIITTRTIEAPLEFVFETISDVRNFRKAVPQIIKIEFLTDQQQGVGTRSRETRMMNGSEQTVDLEVAELVENQYVRMVSDAGGTIWDTLFKVSPSDGGVELTMQMDVKPYTLFARIMNFFIRGVVVKAVARDMDSVKSFCESAS